MARIQHNDSISFAPANLLFPPSSHRVIETDLGSNTRSRFSRKSVGIMDHTSLSQSNTADDLSLKTPSIHRRSEDSQAASDPEPTLTTANEVGLNASASSTAIGTSSSTPTTPSASSLSATSPSMTTILTSSSFSFPSSIVSYSSLSTSTDSSTPSSVNTITSPPSSAYTTGIYIALGIFLFFGIMCALVTSPVTANAIKGIFRRRGRAREQ